MQSIHHLDSLANQIEQKQNRMKEREREEKMCINFKNEMKHTKATKLKLYQTSARCSGVVAKRIAR